MGKIDIKIKKEGTGLQTLIQKGFKIVEVGDNFLYFKNKKVFEYRCEYYDESQQCYYVRMYEVHYDFVADLAADEPDRYLGLVKFLDNGVSLTAVEVYNIVHKRVLNMLAKLLVGVSEGIDNIKVNGFSSYDEDFVGYTILGTEKEQEIAFRILKDVFISNYSKFLQILTNKNGEYSKMVFRVTDNDELARAVSLLPDVVESVKS